MSYSPKEATPTTAAINKAGESFYPLEDRHDFHDARLNLIAPIPNGQVLNDAGDVVFDLGDFAYLTDDAPRPDTVDASLWRTSQVIHEGGLYKVVDRIYQVRNNDIAVDEMRDQLVMRLRPLTARFEEEQRVDEELRVDGQVRIEPIVCIGKFDAEGLRKSHDRAPASGTREAAVS